MEKRWSSGRGWQGGEGSYREKSKGGVGGHLMRWFMVGLGSFGVAGN